MLCFSMHMSGCQCSCCQCAFTAWLCVPQVLVALLLRPLLAALRRLLVVPRRRRQRRSSLHQRSLLAAQAAACSARRRTGKSLRGLLRVMRNNPNCRCLLHVFALVVQVMRETLISRDHIYSSTGSRACRMWASANSRESPTASLPKRAKLACTASWQRTKCGQDILFNLCCRFEQMAPNTSRSDNVDPVPHCKTKRARSEP